MWWICNSRSSSNIWYESWDNKGTHRDMFWLESSNIKLTLVSVIVSQFNILFWFSSVKLSKIYVCVSDKSLDDWVNFLQQLVVEAASQNSWQLQRVPANLPVLKGKNYDRWVVQINESDIHIPRCSWDSDWRMSALDDGATEAQSLTNCGKKEEGRSSMWWWR